MQPLPNDHNTLILSDDVCAFEIIDLSFKVTEIKVNRKRMTSMFDWFLNIEIDCDGSFWL
jgi:hypothetical protein